MSKITGKKQSARILVRYGYKHPELRNSQILGFIDDDLRERFVVPLGEMRCDLSEDSRPGVYALSLKEITCTNEDWPDTFPLFGAHAILAPEARHIPVGVQRVDLPSIDNIVPFRD